MKGSGYGHFRQGERITGLAELKPGMLLTCWTRQFDTYNVCRVSRVEIDPAKGRTMFYASFVNPTDPKAPRLPDDSEFCVWAHDFCSNPCSGSAMTLVRHDPPCVFHHAVYIPKRDRERVARLLPNGKPRYVRIYDNRGESADRYTVVFTGNYDKGEPPHVEWSVLGMSEAPFHPQGVGLHSGYPYPVDTIKNGRPWACWPPAMGRKCHLGWRISFDDLPSDCQHAVLDDYSQIWGLPLPPYAFPKPSFQMAVG